MKKTANSDASWIISSIRLRFSKEKIKEKTSNLVETLQTFKKGNFSSLTRIIRDGAQFRQSLGGWSLPHRYKKCSESFAAQFWTISETKLRIKLAGFFVPHSGLVVISMMYYTAKSQRSLALLIACNCLCFVYVKHVFLLFFRETGILVYHFPPQNVLCFLEHLLQYNTPFFCIQHRKISMHCLGYREFKDAKKC